MALLNNPANPNKNTIPTPVVPPNLPNPSSQYNSQFQNQFGQVLRQFFNSLTNLCNYLLNNQTLTNSGSITFQASTTAVVSFPQAASNTTYQVALSGNSAGFCWVSPTDKTLNGFTIHCSVSNSNSTDWTAVL